LLPIFDEIKPLNKTKIIMVKEGTVTKDSIVVWLISGKLA
jgi:hypothetical protein